MDQEDKPKEDEPSSTVEDVKESSNLKVDSSTDIASKLQANMDAGNLIMPRGMEQPEPVESKEESKNEPKKDKIVIQTLIIILIAFALVFFLPRFFTSDNIETLEQLHEKNLIGKLSDDEGVLYQGLHSFVLYDDLWYSRVFNPAGDRMFNVPFHYNPKEVEDIPIQGILDNEAFNFYNNVFMTFDPLDDNLNYIAVSTGEIDAVLINLFGKGVVASCTRNETVACIDRPIINCNSTDSPVIYLADEEETNILFLNNCIIISGKGEEILRATDRMLFDILGIIN